MKPLYHVFVSLVLGNFLFTTECSAIVAAENDGPTREEIRKYRGLISEYGLTHQDIEALKLTTSAPSNRIISPENIKSITLGAPISTSTSSFDYGSIFDGGMLNKGGLINVLDGDSIVRSEVQVTANTMKTFDTSQNKYNGQIAAQWGGFRASLGYLHEGAQQKSRLTGEVTANAYQNLTKQIALDINTGNDPIEMSPYLRGTPFDAKDLGRYVTVTLMAVPDKCEDIKACPQYTKVTVNQVYEGLGQDNPRSHVEVLALLEGYFDSLSSQYGKYIGNAKVAQSSQEDMRALRKAINQSIQAFYDKYGDSFTSKLYGYNQVRATAKMIKNESAENDESNNAVSIGAAYGGFVGGGQAQIDVQWYRKAAFEENRNSLTVKAEAEPAADTNLSDWEKKVIGFLKDVSPTLAVPSDVVTKQGVPSLPQPTELRYDQTMPPGITLAKYSDYKEVKDNLANTNLAKAGEKNDRTNAINKFIERQAVGQEQQSNRVSSASSLMERLAGVVRPRSQSVAIDAFFSVGSGLSFADNRSSRSGSSQPIPNVGWTPLATLPLNDAGGHIINLSQHERELRREMKRLKAEGRRDYKKNHLNAKMTAKQVDRILDLQSEPNYGLASLRERRGNESQFVGLSKAVISGFDVAPYAAHLAVLRPNLKVPGDRDPRDNFTGFPNSYDLAMLLHNYEIIETYLEFISRFEVSGLKNKKISSNYTKFFSGDRSTGYIGFQAQVMDMIEIALASGKDIPITEVNALLQSSIFGPVTNEVFNYKQAKLFKLLGNDGFKYVMSLLDSEVTAAGKWEVTDEKRLDIIRRAPGGYIPVKLDAKQNPYFVSNTKANIAPPGHLFEDEWRILADSIPLENGFDLSRLYSQRNQTPLYPVFTFNDKNSSALLFVQFAASATLVYGRNYSLYPNYNCAKTEEEKCGSLTSIETILPTLQGAEIYGQMRSQDNGFDVNKLSFSYSLIYPKASEEDNLAGALKNNALVLGLDGSAIEQPKAKLGGYALAPTIQVLAPFQSEGKVEVANTYDALDFDYKGDDKISKFTRVDLNAQSGAGNTWGYMVLLPVDSQLLTEGRFDSLFTYSNDTTPAAVYGQRPDGRNGFDGGIVRAMLH